MADQLQSTTSTATTGTTMAAGALPIPLPAGLSSVLTRATSALQSTLDRILPPSTRASLQQKLTAFARDRPLLASFLLSQIALSGLPLALFLIMSVTVTVFALLAGVLVGVLGAAVFVVLALGFALLVLLPTLAVTTFFAVAVWLWGLGAYYLVKWFNEESVPGVHRPLGQGLKEKVSGGLEGLLANGREKEDERPEEERVAHAHSYDHGHGHGHGYENGYANEQQHKIKAKHRKVKTPDRFSSKNTGRGIAEADESMLDLGTEMTGIAV